MKKLFLFVVAFASIQCATYGQKFSLIVDGTSYVIVDQQPITLPTAKFKTLQIQTDKDYGKKFIFDMAGTQESFNGDGRPNDLTVAQYTIPQNYFIEAINADGSQGATLISFALAVTDAGNTDKLLSSIILPSQTIEQFWSNEFRGSNVVFTKYGIVLKDGNTNYKGNNYTHLFFDQYGNNLFSSIPPGIPERQYIVHVIYLAPEEGNYLIYDINETAGGFNPVLNIQNSDLRMQLGKTLAAGSDNKIQPVKYKWFDKEKELSTSTDDINFDLNRIIVNPDTVYSFSKTKIGSYTIKMTTTYNVSLDIGLVRSNLENPTYQLLPSANDPTQNVVKRSGGGNRGIVTAMATFYTSPIVLFEKYVMKKKIPSYKVWGRNYLDDHTLWERIYPTIGVGFTDNTLQNLFYGINWEVVRGGAIFLGGHYGLVNTFDAPTNLVYGQTAMTQSDFNLRQNTAWRSDFAVGIKVDVKIVSGLFAAKTN